MKRFFIILAAFLVLTSSVVCVSALEREPEDVIRNDFQGIPDTALYNAVLNQADANRDGHLTVGEAEQVYCLLLRGLGISSLQGIKYFKNLVSLGLEANKLTNLNGMEGLEKLKELSLDDNQLTNIEQVRSCPKLLFLNVSHNDISVLPDMSDLSLSHKSNFSYNRLTINEMRRKLPKHFGDETITSFYPPMSWIEYWSKTQSVDPIPEPAFTKIENEVTGISIQGSIIPDATLEVDYKTSESSIYYTIRLVRDYEAIEPNGEVTISIPSEYNDMDVYIVKSDGSMEKLKYQYLEECYIFNTDEILSTYALVRNVETATDPTETMPETVTDTPTVEMTTASGTETVTASTNVATTVTDPVKTTDTTTPYTEIATTYINNSSKGTVSTGGTLVFLLIIAASSIVAIIAIFVIKKKPKNWL